MDRVTLLIGTVAYRSGQTLLRCLESIFSSPPRTDLAVCVVDNDPSWGDGRAVRARFPGVATVDSPENLGFGSGMNRAFLARPSRYFLILNPDTEVRPGALDRLVAFLEAHPEAGAVGPRLWYADGNLHPSARRFPTLPLALLEAADLNLRFPNNRFMRRHTYDAWDHASPRSVDWITGAAILVRSDLFSRIGRFDERFFMYSEEIDLCRRIRNAGFEVAFLPDAGMVHLHAHSTRQTDVRQVEFYKSLCLYIYKHHGRMPGLAVRLVVLARQLVYIPLVCIRYLSGFRWAQLRRRVLPAIRLLEWAVGLSHRR